MKKLIAVSLIFLTSCTMSEMTEKERESMNAKRFLLSIQENIICIERDNLCLCCNGGDTGCAHAQSASFFQVTCNVPKTFGIKFYSVENASR